MAILQSRKRADLDAVAVSGIAAAWTTYTPTVTASVGTYTTVAGAGHYVKMGKIVFLQLVITITTNGTAAGQAIVTLPFTASANPNVMAGRENNVSGFELYGLIAV